MEPTWNLKRVTIEKLNYICYFLFCQREAQAYGIDWNGPVPIECETDEVVPETFSPLNHLQEQELLHTLSPFAPSNNYGIDLYLLHYH